MFYYMINAFYAISLILLLLFIVSKEFRKWFFVKIWTNKYWTLMLNKYFYKPRSIFLKEFTELKPNKPNEKLNVLEVGVGPGANFDFYPDSCKLTVLEYNDNFKNEFMKIIEKHPKIEFHSFVTGSVEDMNQLKDNTFDVVLTTYLYCSVSDVNKALKEVKRVLKPGGQYFFIEHVAYQDQNSVIAMYQNIVSPLWKAFWKFMSCPCQLNKKTWINIKNTFTSLKLDHSYPCDIPAHFRPQIYGSAVK